MGLKSTLDVQQQYADYAVRQQQWLNSEESAKQKAFWLDQLADAPVKLVRPIPDHRQRYRRTNLQNQNTSQTLATNRRLLPTRKCHAVFLHVDQLCILCLADSQATVTFVLALALPTAVGA